MDAGTEPAKPAGAAIAFDDGPSAPLHGQRITTQPKGDTGKRRPTPARKVAVALSACKGRLITTAAAALASRSVDGRNFIEYVATMPLLS